MNFDVPKRALIIKNPSPDNRPQWLFFSKNSNGEK
jgi:hypothetical protein